MIKGLKKGVMLALFAASVSSAWAQSAVDRSDSTSLENRGAVNSSTLWNPSQFGSQIVSAFSPIKGAAGPQGPAGATGATGATGPAGPAGSSAGLPARYVVAFIAGPKQSASDCGSTLALFNDGTTQTVYTPNYNCGGGGSSH